MNFFEQLRDARKNYNPPPILPQPEELSADEDAERICNELTDRMWERAYYGMNGVRFELYIDTYHADAIVDYIKQVLEEEGFEYREQCEGEPVIGKGCYHAKAYPQYCTQDEGDASPPKKAGSSILIVEASWQEKGFCLTCGLEHKPSV